MNGLELSRRYYEEVGRPMLEAKFLDYMSRIAVGLVGEGSECLGYDDEYSRDHDFGPGFCLWLTKEDYETIGAALQKAYEALPGEFMGYPARNESRRGGGRVGVQEISSYYRQFIGNEQPPQSLMRWLYLPEHKLAMAVNGEVFVDPLGEFTRIRELLQVYYPEDVRIKKIAARAAVMAQSGQYNYGRCMRRGDTVAAGMALAEFVKAAVSMMYLLNKTYMPYYKWQFRGLKEMAAAKTAGMNAGNASTKSQMALSEVVELLERLSRLGDQSHAWEEPHPAGWNPYVNTLDRKVVIIEKICGKVIEELKRQGMTEGSEDFLEAHTWKIMSRIKDRELRSCHVMEG